MDSSGRVMWIEDDKVVARSEEPMPDPARGQLVLLALEAGAVFCAAAPDGW